MPLIITQLEEGLLSLSQTPHPATALDAADKWAEAYHTYAKEAVVAGAPRALTGTEASLFSAQLAPVFAVVPNTPASVASSLSLGIAAYWAGAIFGPNTATTMAGLPALVTAATTLLAVPNSSETFALGLAAALDVCTRTLVVVNASGAPVPIT